MKKPCVLVVLRACGHFIGVGSALNTKRADSSGDHPLGHPFDGSNLTTGALSAQQNQSQVLVGRGTFIEGQVDLGWCEPNGLPVCRVGR